jgi:hypothetical protein
MGAASEKKQWTAGTVAQAAYSTGFWLFVLGNSACMFPLALSIWAVTKPFDKRKVRADQTEMSTSHMDQRHRGVICTQEQRRKSNDPRNVDFYSRAGHPPPLHVLLGFGVYLDQSVLASQGYRCDGVAAP